MLEIEEIKDGNSITLKLKGKLNSTTADDFKEKAIALSEEYSDMKVDFEDLLYVSSAGLRVILELHKKMKKDNKSFVLINVDEGAMDIIKATGLSRFLIIK